MSQIFPKSANQIAIVSIVLVLTGAATAGALLFFLDRSPYHTKQGQFVAQEVPFSHDHHIEALGLDCRYCHTSVEESRFAGIPPTATCMNCHKQIWANTEMLRPVRESWQTGEPLQWTRVNDLPDYVFFDHSVHIKQGVGCQSCHGKVNEMPLMVQQHSLQMRWCLDCHRDPAQNLRPREQVFNMDWHPSAVDKSQRELGNELMQEYRIASRRELESCSVCHR